MILFKILKAIVYIPLKTFYPSKVVGKENLPKGGAVLVSNHTSNFDGFILAINLHEENYYLAKKELFDNKFKGFVLRNIGCIKIDRNSNDINAIKQCLKVLKGGRKLVIYPEGTRVHNENMELGEIKGGAAMLAIKTHVPIVPIYVNKQPKLFRKITITIGKPFELEKFYEGRLDSERQEQADEILAQGMNELRKKCIERDNANSKEAKKQAKLARKEQKRQQKLQKHARVK